METSDVDDYSYPQDTVELVEQPEVEPHVDAHSSEQLEGIQSWLRGEVETSFARDFAGAFAAGRPAVIGA